MYMYISTQEFVSEHTCLCKDGHLNWYKYVMYVSIHMSMFACTEFHGGAEAINTHFFFLCICIGKIQKEWMSKCIFLNIHTFMHFNMLILTYLYLHSYSASLQFVCVWMYVHMYACMYAFMYVYMYACMYVCTWHVRYQISRCCDIRLYQIPLYTECAVEHGHDGEVQQRQNNPRIRTRHLEHSGECLLISALRKVELWWRNHDARS